MSIVYEFMRCRICNQEVLGKLKLGFENFIFRLGDRALQDLRRALEFIFWLELGLARSFGSPIK